MPKPEKPRGREKVMEAILNAATQLFAEKGVAAVSVRDIAKTADVNHGLVHRHFGSKEQLRLAVQNRLMRQINADIGEHVSWEEAVARGIQALRKNEAFWKVMARTFLDGDFQGDVQSAFPFMQKMVAFLTAAQADGAIDANIDPRLLVAGGYAMIFGLMVFEGYILPGTGLDQEPGPVAMDRIIDVWFSLLRK